MIIKTDQEIQTFLKFYLFLFHFFPLTFIFKKANNFTHNNEGLVEEKFNKYNFSSNRIFSNFAETAIKKNTIPEVFI